MNSKLSLILFGALVTLTVLSAAENLEESSLSEEVASSRLARAADADPGKSKKKSKKNKKASKKNKSKRNNKKASRKDKKSKNKKASKKEKKSKRKNKKADKKNKKSKRKNKKASKKEKKSKNKKTTKKDRKSERKNKNASKKDRKSERKSKKVSKKASKKDRKNKKRKSKQNKKKNSRKSKSQENNREGQSTIPGTCISTAANTLYNGFSKKASNFFRQEKRLQVRLPKIANKLSKASEYNETLDDLVAANASCPAGNVTELDALVATLSECQTNIETACAVPEYNQTQIDECQPIVEGFQSEVEKCVDLTDPADACGCWESPELAALEEGLKDCIIKPSEANVTAAFKACKGAVSDCNKAESDAIPVLVACSKSESDLVAEAETVANNIAALEGAKTAVEAVATSRRHRAAATNCTEFIALVDAREYYKPSQIL